MRSYRWGKFAAPPPDRLRSRVVLPGHPNKRLYHRALREAQRQGVVVEEGTDPAKILQWMIDRKTAQLRHASSEVDKLDVSEFTVDGPFGPVEHAWVRVERRLGEELTNMVYNALRIGLAERLVAVEEARAVLVVRAIKAAAAEIGIPADQVKALGPALRRHLTAVQGGDPVAVEERAAA